MAPGPDHFAAMGFPPRFSLSPEEIERRFRDLSWRLHPDRFAGAGPSERRLALARTTALNDAYRALKDPVRRAAHLLERQGVTLASQAPLPPDLLEEVMELREALAEAKAGGDRDAVEQLVRRVRARREESLGALGEGLSEPAAPEKLRAAAEALARIRYYDRFAEEAGAGSC